MESPGTSVPVLKLYFRRTKMHQVAGNGRSSTRVVLPQNENPSSRRERRVSFDRVEQLKKQIDKYLYCGAFSDVPPRGASPRMKSALQRGAASTCSVPNPVTLAQRACACPATKDILRMFHVNLSASAHTRISARSG